MSFLEIDGQRHAIPTGTSAIGSDASSFIALMGDGVTPRHLVIQADADGQASVARADEDAKTFINGVQLGPQPTPLLHGDKVEVGGHALIFVDERRSGSTQFVNAADLAKFRPKDTDKDPAAGTAATGGRLVSLTDGREYHIEAQLVIGRDAGCDVVITTKRVSRRHAEILPTPKGYVVVDVSTNGTFVNGDRVEGERLLARTDIIRLGEDEFRFYADIVAEAVVEPESKPPPKLDTPPAGAEQRLGNTMFGIPGVGSAPKPPPTAAPGAEHRLGDTMHGFPDGPPLEPPAAPAPGAAHRLGDTMHAFPDSPPPPPPPRPEPSNQALASLLARSGDLKGKRYPIRVPVVNVGRADYNDIVVDDGTVSTIHAKFQRREGIWILVDLDSTNGTFVDGERVSGEVPLAPGAIIRFGDVSMVFEPMDDTIDARQGSSTKLMGAFQMPPQPPASSSGESASAVADPPKRPTTESPNPKESTDRGSDRGFRIWPFK